MTDPTTLDADYTLDEVAEALRVSTRWIRDRIRAGKEGKGAVVEHIRRGHMIRFTAEQVEKLRCLGAVEPTAGEQVTTGRKKSA